MALVDLELTYFSRDTQIVSYIGPRAPNGVDLTFVAGRWYRVAYRKEMAVQIDTPRPEPREFLFLEHPTLPGVAIGFRRDTFLNPAWKMERIPQRTQRKRSSSPGIPPGSVYVGRPSQWGNPAVIGDFHKLQFVATRHIAVAMFYDHCKDMATNDPEGFVAWLKPLIGRDLCCWCPPDEPCHADILIAIARHLKDVIDDPDFRTLIPAGVPNWPEISCIIVL